MLERTIGAIVAQAAACNPAAEALVVRHQNLRLTYSGLLDRARATACGLWGLGIRPGDRVGMWAGSCAEWVYLQIATALTGAVLVNVNPAYRSHELRYVLRRSGIKALFLCERDARANYLEILGDARQGQDDLPLEHVVLLQGQNPGPRPPAPVPCFLPWDRMLAQGREPDLPAPAPGDVVNIQYTSGTTGFPKGVLLTHHNLVNNAWLVGRELKIGPGDRLCAPVPMYHCFGCVMSSLLSLVHGITLVLPAAQFDPLATLETIAAERCTVLHGVPTMFIAELEHPRFREFDLRSLRTGIMAGAPCPIEIMKRVVSEMHCSR